MIHITCGNRTPKIPQSGCSDCEQLEQRVEALEQCCEDVNTALDGKADETEIQEIMNIINGLGASWHYVGDIEGTLPDSVTEGDAYYDVSTGSWYIAKEDVPSGATESDFFFISGNDYTLHTATVNGEAIIRLTDSHGNNSDIPVVGDGAVNVDDTGDELTISVDEATEQQAGLMSPADKYNLDHVYDLYNTECGDPAEIEDAEDANLKSLVVTLTPHQSGTPWQEVQVVLNAKVYGVKWDMANNQCVRTRDAEGITTTTTNFKHSGSVNQNYNNPFDSIYPWSERKLCNIDIDEYMALESGHSITECVTAWEGESGFSYSDQYGVWVYTPEFWGRSYIEDNYRHFEIATAPILGFRHYKEFIVGRYLGRDITLTVNGASKHCNIPSLGMPMANVREDYQHDCAQNYGASLNNIYTLDATSLLYVVEFANMDLQATIGNGVSSLYVQSSLHPSAASTGTTITLANLTSAQLSHFVVGAIVDLGTSDGGNNTARTSITAVSTSGTTTTVTLADSVTVTESTFVSVHGLINIADEGIGGKTGYIGGNTKSNAYYRGQTFYANKFQYILGAYRQTGTGEIWVSNEDECDDYDELNTSAHIDTGLALTQTSGYIKTLGMYSDLSMPPFCTSVASSGYAIQDYCYVPSLATANTILLFGGSASNGTYCGWCGYWRDTAAASSWFYGSCPLLLNP